MSRVQRLYDACNRAFSSGKPGLPTLRHIRWLEELLGTIFIQFHLIINSLARLEFELKLFRCQNLVLNKRWCYFIKVIFEDHRFHYKNNRNIKHDCLLLVLPQWLNDAFILHRNVRIDSNEIFLQGFIIGRVFLFMWEN
jgi:hypothetical protein